MIKLYKILHHKEVFGDDKPRKLATIYQKVFGYDKTDSIESWLKDPKLLKDMDLAEIENYCDKPDWENEYPEGKHKMLIEDIKKNGIKIPLVIVATLEDKFQVIEGGHRAGAAKILGLKTVPVFLIREQK